MRNTPISVIYETFEKYNHKNIIDEDGEEQGHYFIIIKCGDCGLSCSYLDAHWYFSDEINNRILTCDEKMIKNIIE